MKKLTILIVCMFMFTTAPLAETVKINHISLNLEDVDGYTASYDSSLEKSYLAKQTKYIRTYTKAQSNNKFLCDVHIAIHDKMTNLNIESKSKHLLLDVANNVVVNIKNNTKKFIPDISDPANKAILDNLKLGELLFIDNSRTDDFVSVTIMSKSSIDGTQFYQISNIIHIYLLKTSFIIYSNGYTANKRYINDTIAAVKDQSNLFIEEIQKMNPVTH